MVRKKLLSQDPKTRNIEEMIRRTPPHLLSGHNRKHLNKNGSTSMNHPIDNISTNPITTSAANYDHFRYGRSSLPIQDHRMYTRVVPQEGETKRYLYLPMLLSIISSKTSISAPYEEGTPKGSGGSQSARSNSRTTDYHPPYHLSSFYPVAPYSNGSDNRKHPQPQELADLQCNEPGTEEQLPLPFYGSSHDTNTSINNITSTRETSSSSILGKHPTAGDPSQSFFQKPTTQQPLETPDMDVECTDELFSLVQSLGTQEYLSSWEKIFKSESSMYGSHHHTSSLHATAGSSGTASEPSLALGLGNHSTFDKRKGKGVHSYCELSTTAGMSESMKKQRKETDQSLSKLALGLDGYGCPKNPG